MLALFALVPLFASAAAPTPTKVIVGASPVVSSAGIFLAVENGFFTTQGLAVEVIDVPRSGAAMTLLLANGTLDVGAGNISAGLLTAIGSGKRIKLVADKGHVDAAHDYIALIVRSDHLASGRYKGLADLKGFKMGLTALTGVSQQIVAERFLAAAGLAATDVEYVQLSYAEMHTALRSKAIDATIQVEPYIAQAELDGTAKNVAGAATVHPGQQSAAILYGAKLLHDNRKAGERFMAAYLQGVRLYNRAVRDPAQRPAVIKALERHIKLDAAVWSRMIPIGLRDDGRLDVEVLTADVAWYRQKGLIKTEIDLEQAVDHSFVDAATRWLDGR